MLVWVIKKEDPGMKGKRYTTEDKIRTLREADSGKPIVDICQKRTSRR